MTNPINYNPNYPEIESTWADWQIQFIQNFTQLGLAFSQNHVPLDDPTVANRGNHTYIQMPEQIADAQTGAQEFSIYSKLVEGQTDQVFFTFPGNTPVVQFTNYQIYTVQPRFDPPQVTFFTFLPGGLIVYFGIFGPFNPGNKNGVFNNLLKLNPAISKNIVSVNLCHIGTTPKYTPAAVPEKNQHLGPNFEFITDPIEIINYIAITPVIPSSNNLISFVVVANT